MLPKYYDHHLSKKEFLTYKRGARLFQEIQKRLLPRYKGHIVAVEPESGQYFVGIDELEAAHRAKAMFPNRVFDFFRKGIVNKLGEPLV